MQYRKKPVVIEAFKFGHDNIPDWFMDKVSSNEIFLVGNGHPLERGSINYADIKTLEGVMTAFVGDFVIKGLKGEIYPCKADIFEMSYEKEEERNGQIPS